MDAKEWNEGLFRKIAIDLERLIDACPEVIFEPSYHDGVATTVDGHFQTWHELAKHYGLDITDFIK